MRAESGEAEATKISLAAYLHLRDKYALLRAGGAAGFGVGPIVVAKSAGPVRGKVAIPGNTTTAAMLLRLFGKFETVAMRFDQVEDAVLRGDADCGVLIHEGRFTYQQKGSCCCGTSGSSGKKRCSALCRLPRLRFGGI